MKYKKIKGGDSHSFMNIYSIIGLIGLILIVISVMIEMKGAYTNIILMSVGFMLIGIFGTFNILPEPTRI